MPYGFVAQVMAEVKRPRSSAGGPRDRTRPITDRGCEHGRGTPGADGEAVPRKLFARLPSLDDGARADLRLRGAQGGGLPGQGDAVHPRAPGRHRRSAGRAQEGPEQDPAHAGPDDIGEALKKAEQQLKELKPLPPAKAKTPPKEEAEPDELVLKPVRKEPETKVREKRNKSALDRIRALEAIKDEVSAEKKKPAGMLVKDKISKGQSLSPEARESAESSYFDQLRDQLQSNWPDRRTRPRSRTARRKDARR